MTAVGGEKFGKEKPKEEILTDEEKKFAEKMSERYIGKLWLKKKLYEANISGGISDKRALAEIKKLDLEGIEEPVASSPEFYRTVVETSLRNMGLFPEFEKERQKIFDEELELFRTASVRKLKQEMKELLREVALIKAVKKSCQLPGENV